MTPAWLWWATEPAGAAGGPQVPLGYVVVAAYLVAGLLLAWTLRRGYQAGRLRWYNMAATILAWPLVLAMTAVLFLAEFGWRGVWPCLLPRWLWARTCINCKVVTRAGCLCFDCVRAAVVPLVLAELVRWLFR